MSLYDSMSMDAALLVSLNERAIIGESPGSEPDDRPILFGIKTILSDDGVGQAPISDPRIRQHDLVSDGNSAGRSLTRDCC
jgi:hypothetical protein